MMEPDALIHALNMTVKNGIKEEDYFDRCYGIGINCTRTLIDFNHMMTQIIRMLAEQRSDASGTSFLVATYVLGISAVVANLGSFFAICNAGGRTVNLVLLVSKAQS